MNRLARLVPLLLLALGWPLPTVGQNATREPSGQVVTADCQPGRAGCDGVVLPQVVPTREALVDALVEIGRERDELRAALGAARDEIARQRASYDALRATLTESEAALTQALDLNVALMESHKTMSSIVTSERRAATRARWLDRLGCTLGVGVAGWDDFSGGAAVTCGVRFLP